MRITYKREIPYPTSRLLAQYFDLEHIAHVHPRSFGQARMVTQSGSIVVWELLSPLYIGFRFRSLIAQEYIPPNQIRTRILKGRGRGAQVFTLFHPDVNSTTLEESYVLPLPDWAWLRFIVSRWLYSRLDCIWDEDLRVGMCHGGWPGVPPVAPQSPSRSEGKAQNPRPPVMGRRREPAE